MRQSSASRPPGRGIGTGAPAPSAKTPLQRPRVVSHGGRKPKIHRDAVGNANAFGDCRSCAGVLCVPLKLVLRSLVQGSDWIVALAHSDWNSPKRCHADSSCCRICSPRQALSSPIVISPHLHGGRRKESPVGASSDIRADARSGQSAERFWAQRLPTISATVWADPATPGSIRRRARRRDVHDNHSEHRRG